MKRLGTWWYNLSDDTKIPIRVTVFLIVLINLFLGSVVFWRQFL